MSSFKLYFSVLSLYFTVPQMWENRMHSSVIFFASFMLLTGLEAGGWLVGFEHCYVKWISDVEYICYVSERFIQKCYPLLTLSKRTIVVPCFSVTKSYHFIQTPVHGVMFYRSIEYRMLARASSIFRTNVRFNLLSLFLKTLLLKNYRGICESDKS